MKRRHFNQALLGIVGATAAGSLSSDERAELLYPTAGPTRFGPAAVNSAADHIVFTDGTSFYVQDGADTSVVVAFADAAAAIQNAVNSASAAGGGKIFLKAGTYPITSSRIDLDAVSNITMEGTDATILTCDLSAALLIDNQSDSITLDRLTFRDCAGLAINCKSGSNVRFTNCVFENIQSSGIQGRLGDDPEDPLHNIWVKCCRFTAVDLGNDGSSGARGAIYFYRSHGLWIENNLVEQCGSIGISVQVCSSQIVCAHNVVRDNDVNAIIGQGHGIYFGRCEKATIVANVVTGNGGNGFEGGSGTASCEGEPGSAYTVAGNTFIGNGFNNTDPGGSGHFRNAVFISGRDHLVSDNICRDNWGTGISVGRADKASRLVVENNVVGNNNVGNDGRARHGSGIVCQDFDFAPIDDQMVMIKDNLIYNDEGSLQLRAIQCEDTADGIVIEGNRVSGHAATDASGDINPAIRWDPNAANIVVRRNHGFRSETSGLITRTYPPGVTNGFIVLDLSAKLDLQNSPGGGAVTPLALQHLRITPARAAGGVGYSGGYFTWWIDRPSDASVVFPIYLYS